MNIDGVKEMALLRDVQVHAFKPQILHVDFQRVAADHKIHLKVPLHFLNAETCPGVKLHGGLVSHVMTEVDITCLPGQLPEYIEVDLAKPWTPARPCTCRTSSCPPASSWCSCSAAKIRRSSPCIGAKGEPRLPTPEKARLPKPGRA
jgi:hypothetical protein